MEKLIKGVVFSFIETGAIAFSYGIENKVVVLAINAVMIGVNIFLLAYMEKQKVIKEEKRKEEEAEFINKLTELNRYAEAGNEQGERIGEDIKKVCKALKDENIGNRLTSIEEMLKGDFIEKIDGIHKDIARENEEMNKKLAKEGQDIREEIARESQDINKKLAKESQDIIRELVNKSQEKNKEIVNEIISIKEKETKIFKKLENDVFDLKIEVIDKLTNINKTIEEGNETGNVRKVNQNLEEIRDILGEEFINKIEEIHKNIAEENKKINDEIVDSFIKLGEVEEKNIKLLKDSYAVLNSQIEA